MMTALLSLFLSAGSGGGAGMCRGERGAGPFSIQDPNHRGGVSPCPFGLSNRGGGVSPRSIGLSNRRGGVSPRSFGLSNRRGGVSPGSLGLSNRRGGVSPVSIGLSNRRGGGVGRPAGRADVTQSVPAAVAQCLRPALARSWQAGSTAERQAGDAALRPRVPHGRTGSISYLSFYAKLG